MEKSGVAAACFRFVPKLENLIVTPFIMFYYVLSQTVNCTVAATQLTTNTQHKHNHQPRVFVFVFVWKWKTLQLHNFPLPKMQCVLRFHGNVSF